MLTMQMLRHRKNQEIEIEIRESLCLRKPVCRDTSQQEMKIKINEKEESSKKYRNLQRQKLEMCTGQWKRWEQICTSGNENNPENTEV